MQLVQMPRHYPRALHDNWRMAVVHISDKFTP